MVSFIQHAPSQDDSLADTEKCEVTRLNNNQGYANVGESYSPDPSYQNKERCGHFDLSAENFVGMAINKIAIVTKKAKEKKQSRILRRVSAQQRKKYRWKCRDRSNCVNKKSKYSDARQWQAPTAISPGALTI